MYKKWIETAINAYLSQYSKRPEFMLINSRTWERVFDDCTPMEVEPETRSTPPRYQGTIVVITSYIEDDECRFTVQ